MVLGRKKKPLDRLCALSRVRSRAPCRLPPRLRLDLKVRPSRWCRRGRTRRPSDQPDAALHPMARDAAPPAIGGKPRRRMPTSEGSSVAVMADARRRCASLNKRDSRGRRGRPGRAPRQNRSDWHAMSISNRRVRTAGSSTRDRDANCRSPSSPSATAAAARVAACSSRSADLGIERHLVRARRQPPVGLDRGRRGGRRRASAPAIGLSRRDRERRRQAGSQDDTTS